MYAFNCLCAQRDLYIFKEISIYSKRGFTETKETSRYAFIHSRPMYVQRGSWTHIHAHMHAMYVYGYRPLFEPIYMQCMYMGIGPSLVLINCMHMGMYMGIGVCVCVWACIWVYPSMYVQMNIEEVFLVSLKPLCMHRDH